MKKILVLLGLIMLMSSAATTLAQNATDSGVSEDEVRESLQERLRRAAEEKSEEVKQVLSAQNRTAIIGKLTDIANDTLTIKAGEMEELASVNNDTVLIRKGKTVKLEDVQIGDEVIAMGYRNGNKVLEAKRVVATDKNILRSRRTILKATVEEVAAKKNYFTVKHDQPAELGGPETYTVTVPPKSDLDLDKLETGSVIVLVGTPDKDNEYSLTLRTHKLLQ